MHHFAIVLALALLPHAQPDSAPPPIDPCDSLVIAQTRAALAELRATAAAHCGPANTPITAVYEGSAAIEAHMMRPGMVRTVPIRLEIIADPRAGALSLRETSGPPAAPRTEATLVLRDRAAEQPATDKPFTETAAADAPTTIADAAAWFPATAVHAALAAAPSCRPGPSCVIDDESWSPITFTDAAGRACTLLIDAEHRVCRVERLSAHQRLGDVCDWTRFDDWVDRDGVAVPRRLSRFVVQGSVTVRFELALVSSGFGTAPEEAFLLPQERREDIPTWGQAPPPSAEMEFVNLAPALWSVEIAAADARVLVLERPDDLVLLGAPDGDAVCGDLVRALADRFPGKPIGLAAFGHHHPSPSGGLRALAAAGATIVAPRPLEPYVRGLLSRPTSLGPPAVPAPEQPRLTFFDGELTIDGGGTSIRLIDIGERSSHAFCYVVFYLPGPGIIFEDDLGYFPQDGSARVSPRLMGLADTLEELKIVPKRLVQLWPVRGVHREVEWSLVTAMIKAERDRQQSR